MTESWEKYRLTDEQIRQVSIPDDFTTDREITIASSIRDAQLQALRDAGFKSLEEVAEIAHSSYVKGMGELTKEIQAKIIMPAVKAERERIAADIEKIADDNYKDRVQMWESLKNYAQSLKPPVEEKG